MELIFLHRNLPGLLNNNPPQISVGNGVERDFWAAIPEDSQYFTLTFSFPNQVVSLLLARYGILGTGCYVGRVNGLAQNPILVFTRTNIAPENGCLEYFFLG